MHVAGRTAAHLETAQVFGFSEDVVNTRLSPGSL